MQLLHRLTVPAWAAVIVLLAACGSTATSSPPTGTAASPLSRPAVLPTIVSSELGVGHNRIVFSFLDSTGTKPIAAPDRTAKVRFEGPKGEKVAAPDGTFVWAIENVSGVYVTSADFPTVGSWTAVFTTAAPGSPESTVGFAFDVAAKVDVVHPGDEAPSVATPTLKDVGGNIAAVSTDAKPDKAFYETSVADALAAHKPFVLIFATPKFCRTATCGPTLDKIKTVAAAHPGVTFINVEPYQLALSNGQLQPVFDANGGLQTVPASDAYRLRSEPYVFVVNKNGVVTASFELIFSPDEINAAVSALG